MEKNIIQEAFSMVAESYINAIVVVLIALIVIFVIFLFVRNSGGDY